MADRYPWYDAFYYDDTRDYYDRLRDEQRGTRDNDRSFRGVEYDREEPIYMGDAYRYSPGWLGAQGVAMPSYGPWGAYGPHESYREELEGSEHLTPTRSRARTLHRLQSLVAEGPHSGKGPGRSDARILDDAHARLTHHGRLDASRIQIAVDDGEITLRGSVDSRHDKRMAEDALETIPGVKDIHNRLRIDG
ncbi:MAG TPA: BON domain-containing protein [Trueperaceae bacterium]